MRIAGAAVGAKTGAFIGSAIGAIIFPGAGTLIGGFIGSLAGVIAGKRIANRLRLRPLRVAHQKLVSTLEKAGRLYGSHRLDVMLALQGALVRPWVLARRALCSRFKKTCAGLLQWMWPTKQRVFLSLLIQRGTQKIKEAKAQVAAATHTLDQWHEAGQLARIGEWMFSNPWLLQRLPGGSYMLSEIKSAWEAFRREYRIAFGQDPGAAQAT